MLAVVRGLFVLFIGAVLLSPAVAAVGTSRDKPKPLNAQQSLLNDAHDGTLDHHSLTRAALIAGGLSDAKELNRLELRVVQLAGELRSSILFTGEPAEKARVLHEFLHTHVLHRYEAGVTDLKSAVDDGVYNCVSATVLYIAVGRLCGLELTAEQSRGHVRCVLGPPGQELAIETTQSTWAAPAAHPQPRRLREAELLAMFYYNRGHQLHGEQRFDEAVQALLVAWELDPRCPEVQGNLLATLHNWAMSCEEAGDLVGAERIRASILRLFPGR